MIQHPGASRLDNISRPNLAGVARGWSLVTPNDTPPAGASDVGNTGVGCFGLFVAMEGYVRVVFRGAQFSALAGDSHLAQWLTNLMPVQLMIGGQLHPVQWLQGIRESVRIWATEGTYLWGEAVHVLAHDSTVPQGHLFSLRV